MSTDRPSFPFQARYDGVCAAECGNRIHPGDHVRYEEGQLVHAACFPVEEPLRPVCSKCWLEVSVSGACGCEGRDE